jgi:hypothetical protein
VWEWRGCEKCVAGGWRGVWEWRVCEKCVAGGWRARGVWVSMDGVREACRTAWVRHA